MKRKLIFSVCLLITMFLLFSCGGDENTKLLAGEWEAEYYSGGATEKFTFIFKANIFGALSGKVLASRNGKSLPNAKMKNVKYNFPEISFEIPRYKCRFEGKLNPPSGTISGYFYYSDGTPSKRMTFRGK